MNVLTLTRIRAGPSMRPQAAHWWGCLSVLTSLFAPPSPSAPWIEKKEGDREEDRMWRGGECCVGEWEEQRLAHHLFKGRQQLAGCTKSQGVCCPALTRS